MEISVVIFLYYILTETVFICSFLDYTHGSYSYWHVDSYNNYYYLTPCEFSCQHLLVVFHLSLKVEKYPQVFMTLLSILVDVSIAVVWSISIILLLSNSSRYFSKLSGAVHSVQSTIDITVTQMFHVLFFGNV